MNINRVFFEPAYVLHRRSYRESSFLIELFSYSYGRLTVLAKGVRKAKSNTCGLLQPFVPLLVSWSGKSELMTLTKVEPKTEAKQLPTPSLSTGFYLNELLMFLLQKWDAHPKLFQVYEQTIDRFKGGDSHESLIRFFEKQLLEEIGYGFLPKSAPQQTLFLKDRDYYFIPEQGFVLTDAAKHFESANVFSGQNLLAIAREEFHCQSVLNDAKRLIRLILKPLLGAKQIHSRRLFIRNEETTAS